MGGRIGGLCGFELEPYRQECLHGIFGETSRDRPVKSVHTRSHVKFRDQHHSHPPWQTQGLPALPPGQCDNVDIINIISRTSKIKPVGCRTEYGVPQNPPYDIISGVPRQPRRYVGPQYKTFARRIPVYLLGQDIQGEALDKEPASGLVPDARLPTPTLAGVAGPQRLRNYQFLTAEYALKPPGSSEIRCRQIKSREGISSSFNDECKDRQLSRPRTSAQDTGWRAMQSYPNQFNFGKKTCRETRFAQCMTLGPRNINGHGGQLAL